MTHKTRAPLHPQEALLVAILCLQLVFLPWAFGTMHVWSQVIVAIFAVTAFAVSLCPRNYDGRYSNGAAFRMVPFRQLVAFPLFWLGLTLCFLLIVQGHNPAWEFRINSKSWWLQRLPHVEWLPSSTRTPFARFNIWRAFLIYSSAWLSVCAVWIGITRRRSLQIVFGVLVGNSVVLACVGFAQRLLDEPRVLWIRTFKDAVSFSSFVYQNHGGAYFGLAAAVCLGLALWYLFDGRRRMARSSSAPVWLIFAGVLVFAVLSSLSRGAVLTFVVFCAGATLAWFVLRWQNPTPNTTPRIVSVALALSFAAVMVCVVRYVDFRPLAGRFHEMVTLRSDSESISSRNMARHAAWDMYRDYWLLGSGAGSYRYLYTPEYVRKYPPIYRGGREYWEHAHIDWLEIPTELGAIGVLLIAASWVWCLQQFRRQQGWRHPMAMLVLLGCCQTLIHATIDFPFQNPAVLTTWWVILIGSLRWLEIESGNSKQGRWPGGGQIRVLLAEADPLSPNRCDS